MIEIKVIKCPRLNKVFRSNCVNGSPDLEVVVAFGLPDEFSSQPVSIMCDEYDAENKQCRITKGEKCTYSKWERL